MPQATTPPSINEDVAQTNQAIAIMEQMIASALPKAPLTPDQLGDLGEMMITLMFLKRVTPEYWAEHAREPLDLIRLCMEIKAENNVRRVKDMPQEAVAVLEEAIAISQKEIKAIRGILTKELELLRQVPALGTTRH